MVCNKELDRLETLTQIMERHLRSAVTEGWRRTANLFDDLEFMYSAVSSGKDSMFMTNICLLELGRRRWLCELWDNNQKDEVKKILERYSKIRESGIASQRNERITNQEDEERIFGPKGIFRKWKNQRIAVMSMDYELNYNESRQVKLRMWKEYATDFEKILPKGMSLNKAIQSDKTVETLGFDLRWVSDVAKENPAELTYDDFAQMTPRMLMDFYGKKMVYGYEMCFPIAWENTAGVSDSRYFSYDPSKKDLWVMQPPIEQDPHHEWCMVYENMYDSFHGLRPMIEISSGMTDQLLRQEFSKFINNAVTEAIEAGWPEKQYDPKTQTYI